MSLAGRWLRRCGVGLGAVIALVLVLALGLHIRLSQGPIAVDFLLRPLEAALNRDLHPLRMRIGRTVLRYDEKGWGLGLRLNDIRILDEQGNAVATAPFAAISLSSRALLQATLAPYRIELLQPKLLLTVTPDNRLTFQAARPASNADGASLTAELPVTGDQVDNVVKQALEEALGSGAGSSGTMARTTYLNSVGLSDALFVVDYHGVRSIWGVPAFVIQRRDNAAGIGRQVQAAGTVLTGSGSFTVNIDVRREATRDYAVGVAMGGLAPADLAQAFPPLAAMQPFTTPVSLKADFVVAADGDLTGLTASLSAAVAPISTQAACAAPLSLDAAELKVRYSGDTGMIDVLPSTLATNIGRASLVGQIAAPATGAVDRQWRFDLQVSEASLGSGDGRFEPLPIAAARLRGAYDPPTQRLGLDRLHIPLGDGALDIAGRSTAQGGLQLEAIASRLDFGVLKRIWPSCLSEDARTWIRQNVQSGRIEQASVQLGLADIAGRAVAKDAAAAQGQVIIEGTISDLAATAINRLPPLIAPTAKFALNNNAFQISAATAVMTLDPDRELTLRDGLFAIPDVGADIALGRLTGEISSSVETALDVLTREPLKLLDRAELANLGGQQTGRWAIELPLLADLKQTDVQVRGKAKVKDLHSTAVPADGAPALHGGSLDLDIADGAVTVGGDVLVGGVDFKLTGRRALARDRVIADPLPMTLKATLDDADRDQLGIRVNHMVRGEVAIVAQIMPDSAPETAEPGRPRVLVKADLADAELVLDTMAWRKAPGAPANLSVVVAPQADGSIDLEDFRLTGNEIGVGGTLKLDRDKRLQSFSFPDFSIDVVTRLELTGKRRADNVLAVHAQGPTFDGRKLFRSLFSAGRITDRDLPVPRDSDGIDLTAEIGTMVGVEDTSLHQVAVSLSRRKGRMTALEATGTLDGGGAIGVRLPPTPEGPRTLYVETKDAGHAFKLVGLYRNIEGGEASLKVDLDGATKTEKSGILWARRFVVLGDPVVDEVLNRSNDAVPQAPAQRKGPVKRARLQFDTLRVPFRVGQGRLNLAESFINGPVLGATLRGVVDFDRRDVRLAGTYVPLYGLNALLGDVPLFGQLLVGRSGEGIFGITFAVNGPIDGPEVLVNPISAVAPGIFRQIFEFDPNGTFPAANPGDGKPAKPRRKVRSEGASSLPPSTGPADQTSIGEALPPAVPNADPSAASGAKKPATTKKKAVAEPDWSIDPAAPQ